MKLNRKWLLVIALVMSLAMATAGTLAYLSDNETATNTFTVGNVDIELEEPKWDEDDQPTLLPGVEIDKDPQIKNVGNTDAWVWMEIIIPAELYNIIELDYNTTDWKKADATTNTDGDYVVLMKYPSKLAANVTTPAAFTKVSIDSSVTSLPDVDTADIVVNAYAIQAAEIANIDAAIAAYDGATADDSDDEEDETPTGNAVDTADELIAALTAGNDVYLTANIDMESNAVTIAEDVTIDLNGYTVSGTGETSQDYMIMVKNGATLDIKDSSSDDSGKITYAQGDSSTGWAIDLEGQLNLYAGTLELTGENWSIGYAVDVRPNAWGTNYTEDTVFHMYGGKIVSSDGAVRVASSSSDSYGNIVASFIMDAGEIDAAYDGVFIQQSNAAYDTLNVAINGGTITSDVYPVRFYGPNATSVNSGAEKPVTLTIAAAATVGVDGDYNTEKTWYEAGVVAYAGGTTLDNLNQYAAISIN